MGATRERGATEMAIRRIEEESMRMGVLVEDLLTLARLDETREASRAPVDFTVLARDAVQDARAMAPGRPIHLRAGEEAVVWGDPDQLRQILANLLRNALVHTPAHSPVEVSVGQDEASVTIDVRDHGPGLPDESQGRLFERFWRSEGGRERGRAGAGLGLAIVSGIVDAHHGQVHAANAPGGGALFSVRLPRATGPVAGGPPSS